MELWKQDQKQEGVPGSAHTPQCLLEAYSKGECITPLSAHYPVPVLAAGAVLAIATGMMSGEDATF